MTKTVTRAHLAEVVYYLPGLQGGHISRDDAVDLVGVVLHEIADALAAGEEVTVHRFARWRTSRSGPRPGRNPKRPEAGQVLIPAQTRVLFKPSPELRAAVERGNRK